MAFPWSLNKEKGLRFLFVLVKRHSSLRIELQLYDLTLISSLETLSPVKLHGKLGGGRATALESGLERQVEMA